MEQKHLPSILESATVSRCTFAVSDVTPATVPLRDVDYHAGLAKFLGGRVEACSRYVGRLVDPFGAHPLIETLHRAFQSHYPVCLSPDVIWLTLMQGIARHVNENSKALRPQFVAHDGPLLIAVRRDDFIKGSPENPWPEVFTSFSEQIRSHIGPVHDLMLADFSTTGPAARAASEIVLLDAMQSYFEYEFRTMCGIPSITLEGTPADWRDLVRRMREFSRFGLAWWIDSITPILDEFVAAAEGQVHHEFWESIYKFEGPRGSGGAPHVSGWAARLFPYHQTRDGSLYRNPAVSRPLISRWASRWFPPFRSRIALLSRTPRISPPLSPSVGPEPNQIPAPTAKAPFKWKYLGKECDMEFIGGLLGIRQASDTLCLTPEIGWAVRDASPSRVRRRSETAGLDFNGLFCIGDRRRTSQPQE